MAAKRVPVARVRVEFGPSTALQALWTLRTFAESAALWPFSAELRKELPAEVGRQKEAFSLLSSCIEWLEERGFLAVLRPSKKGAKRDARSATSAGDPAFLHSSVLEVELHEVRNYAVAEGNKKDGPWRATVFALRTLFEALRSEGLVVANGIELNRVGASLETVWVLFESLFAKEKPAPAPKRAEKEPAAKKEEKSAPKAKKAKKSQTEGSFGGLPEDAEPVGAVAREPMSPRGISLDAEFFLSRAGITVWPCSSKQLEQGRKRVLAELHPDRAGEQSVENFRKALRGHAFLVGKTVETPAPRAVRETAKTVPVAQGQWPPVSTV